MRLAQNEAKNANEIVARIKINFNYFKRRGSSGGYLTKKSRKRKQKNKIFKKHNNWQSIKKRHSINIS
jgi:hypothetical protein